MQFGTPPFLIAYVDDQTIFHEIAERILDNHSDYDFRHKFTSGNQFIKAWDTMQHRPHILLLDMDMPDGDGWIVLRWIRDNNIPIRVIVVSALPDPHMLYPQLRKLNEDVILMDKKPESWKALPATLDKLMSYEEVTTAVMTQGAIRIPGAKKTDVRGELINDWRDMPTHLKHIAVLVAAYPNDTAVSIAARAGRSLDTVYSYTSRAVKALKLADPKALVANVIWLFYRHLLEAPYRDIMLEGGY